MYQWRKGQSDDINRYFIDGDIGNIVGGLCCQDKRQIQVASGGEYPVGIWIFIICQPLRMVGWIMKGISLQVLSAIIYFIGVGMTIYAIGYYPEGFTTGLVIAFIGFCGALCDWRWR